MVLISFLRLLGIYKAIYQTTAPTLSQNARKGSWLLNINHKRLLPTYIAIALIWSAGVALPFLLYKFEKLPSCADSVSFRYWTKPWGCFMVLNTLRSSSDSMIFSVLAMVGVPLLLGGAFSAASIILLVKQSRANSHLWRDGSKGRKKWKGVVLIAAMVVAYAVGWAPHISYYTWLYYNYQEEAACEGINYILWMVTSTMISLQPAVNPFLYWLLGDSFHKDFLKLWRVGREMASSLCYCRAKAKEPKLTVNSFVIVSSSH